VLFRNGRQWKEQRRFALKTLRDLGLGKEGMEALIARETEAMLAKVADHNGRYVQSRQLFHCHSLSALWKVTTGADDVDTAQLRHIWEKMERLFEQGNNPLHALLLNHPTLAKIAAKCGIVTLAEITSDFNVLCDKIVADHEASFQEDNLRDFTDEYLKMRYRSDDDPGGSFGGKNGVLNQRGVMVDILQAGEAMCYTVLIILQVWNLFFERH